MWLIFIDACGSLAEWIVYSDVPDGCQLVHQLGMSLLSSQTFSQTRQSMKSCNQGFASIDLQMAVSRHLGLFRIKEVFWVRQIKCSENHPIFFLDLTYNLATVHQDMSMHFFCCSVFWSNWHGPMNDTHLVYNAANHRILFILALNYWAKYAKGTWLWGICKNWIIDERYLSVSRDGRWSEPPCKSQSYNFELQWEWLLTFIPHMFLS